ncbi:unnamed protein product [Adineta ricciae]|uniref:Uncharacterized protein n=1 Tax=Adineta ricciae TaxID=249248 RepID=A0A815PH87_ADIRI|nr:unnamed protein product [Adineta ricciae]CAF1449443.1 unnamed protein product [Adineta ricciae]
MQAESVTVWADLSSQGVMGPYFFDGTVTSQNYMEMLSDYLKDIAYQKKHRTLSSLKQSITSAFSAIDSDLCKKVCESVSERLQKCIDADGRQFEHLY